MSPEQPVFSDPWHAQVFAITIHLNEEGHFTWPDWAKAFGGTLSRHGLHKELDGGEDYFLAWLETLETLLIGEGYVGEEDVSIMKSAWEEAYIVTPHGSPVRLSD